MFHQSLKPAVFTSKEESKKKVLVEFNQAEHTNALITEDQCPASVYTEKACTRQIIILCETDEEALRTARYHFYSTGSNFKIINSSSC